MSVINVVIRYLDCMIYYQFSVITLASSEVRRYDLNNGHFKSQKCPLFESCLFAQNTLEGLFHNWGQDTKLFHPLIFLRHFYAALIILEISFKPISRVITN